MFFPNRYLAAEDKYLCDTPYAWSVTIDFVPNMGRILSNESISLFWRSSVRAKENRGLVSCSALFACWERGVTCLLGKGRGLQYSSHCATPWILNQNINQTKVFSMAVAVTKKIYIKRRNHLFLNLNIWFYHANIVFRTNNKSMWRDYHWIWVLMSRIHLNPNIELS